MLEELQALIAHYEVLINSISREIEGRKSFYDVMIADELEFRLKILKDAMAHDFNYLRDKLIEVCLYHSATLDESINFADNPNTATNTFLFSAVKLICQPRNFKELLAILTPEITHYVELSIPDLPTDHASLAERKAKHDALQPIIEIKPISFLETIPITDTCLQTCVFADNLVFRLDKSVFESPLTLAWHVKCYHALEEISPALTQKLYTHNADFRLLLADIEAKGLTPYILIRNLIWGLQLGGKSYQGEESNANITALHFISIFFDTFNQLPETLRVSLCAMKNRQEQTLESILTHLINPAHTLWTCVESTATAFESLLEAQHANNLLTVKVSEHPEKPVTRNTAPSKALSLERDASQCEHYPFALVEAIAKSLDFKRLDDIVFALRILPTEVYAGFLLNTYFHFLGRLLPAINTQVFTAAQELALLNVYFIKAKQFEFDCITLVNSTSIAIFKHLHPSAFKKIWSSFTSPHEMQFYLHLHSAAWPHVRFDISAHFEHLSLTFKKTFLLSIVDALNSDTLIYEKTSFDLSILTQHIAIFDESERDDIVQRLKTNLVIAIKALDCNVLSHTLNMLVVFKAMAEIPTIIDENNQNVLHLLLDTARVDTADCLRQLVHSLPNDMCDALLSMRDRHGKQPIEYVILSSNFLFLLPKIAPEKRLPLLINANDQLHDYVKKLHYAYKAKHPQVNQQTIIYINLLRLLPWPAMVVFLTKTRHENIIILDKILALTPEEREHIKDEFPAHFFLCVNILADININTALLRNHFINLLIKQNNWLMVHNGLRNLLKKEITRPRFFTPHSSANPEPLNALFRFYRDHQILLSPADYLNAIEHYKQDTQEYHAESRLALCVLTYVLSTDVSKRLSLLTADDQALFALLSQLSVNRPEHKHRLFNPVLLLKVYASFGSRYDGMQEELDFNSLRINIRCLNASLFNNMPFNILMTNSFFSLLSTRFMTSAFLALEVFQYFVNLRLSSTTILEYTSALVTGFTLHSDERAPWFSHLMYRLNHFELNPNHNPLLLERLDIFRMAFNLYDMAVNHTVTRATLINEAKMGLMPLSSIQRLIILFFRPAGETTCLYEILMPDIQAIMKVMFKNADEYSLGVANSHALLFFSSIDLEPQLEKLFHAHQSIDNVDIENAILHLLMTRTEACVQIHKHKNLLVHYLNTSRARSHRIIRLLAQFPKNACYQISQSLLNTILAGLTNFSRHFPHDENTQTSIAEAITILRNLGALRAAELSDPECKAISRLFSKHSQHYQTLIDNYEDDEPVDQQFLYQDAICKIGLLNTPVKSTIQCLELLKALGESTDMFSLTLQRREHLDICQQNDPLRKAYLGLIKTFFRPNTKEDLLRLLFPTYHQFLNLSITAGKLTLSPVPLPPDFRVPLTDTFYTKAEHDDWLQPYLLVDGNLIDLTTTPTLPEHFENTQNFCASTSFLLRIYDRQYHPIWRHYPVTFIGNLKFEHCHDKYSTFKFLESLHPDCFTKALAVFLFEHRGPHHHYLVYKKNLSAFHPRQFLQLMKLYKDHCDEKHSAPHDNFEKFVTLYESNLTPAMRKKYHCLTNKSTTTSKGLFFNKAAPTQPNPNPERQQINHGN